MLTTGYWLLLPQIILDEIYEEVDLAFGEYVAEGNHSVAAVRDVIVDLGVGLVFVFAVADVGYYAAVVERFAFSFGAMADRAVLAKERGFVGFAVDDRITLRIRRGATCDHEASK